MWLRVWGVCDVTNHIVTNNALLSGSHLIGYTPLNLNVSLFLISGGLPLPFTLLDVVFMFCIIGKQQLDFFAFIPLYKRLWEDEVKNIITFSMSFWEHTFITSAFVGSCHSFSFNCYYFSLWSTYVFLSIFSFSFFFARQSHNHSHLKNKLAVFLLLLFFAAVHLRLCKYPLLMWNEMQMQWDVSLFRLWVFCQVNPSVNFTNFFFQKSVLIEIIHLQKRLFNCIYLQLNENV